VKTRVIFIIDGSGSMGSKASDVREGFNTYVKELKKSTETAKDITLSAVVFNTRVFPLFRDLSLSKVPSLGTHNYAPGGNTALYDAIGEALEDEKGQKPVIQRQSRYIVVIMTDGEENSSHIYNKADIAGKIARREASKKWAFVYLGADQNSFAEAHGIQISAGNTYGGFAMNSAGFTDVAAATNQYQYASNRGDNNPLVFARAFAATPTAKMSRSTHHVPTNTVDSTYNPTKGVTK
jgi:uncharacterized protein YegL